MYWLAGACSTGRTRRPAGSTPVDGAANLWWVGDLPQARVRTASTPRRRVVVVGTCGASHDELNRLASSGVPDDIAWRWPGAYVVAEQTEVATTIWTDLACAVPVYTTLFDGTVYWATTARGLAGLTGAAVSTERLAAELLAPSSPLLTGRSTYFEGIDLIPAGHRLRIASNGTALARMWWPATTPGRQGSFRAELNAAVGIRVDDAVTPSTDLSGGLDSSSLTLLAARRVSSDRSVAAFTVHAPFDRPAGDLRYALDAAARPGVAHHLLLLEADHLPYGGLDSIRATDEPAPSTRAYARFAFQMSAMVDQVSTDTHLTGDGGDSLLCTPEVWIADLIATHRYGEAAAEIVRLARARRVSARKVLRDVIGPARHDAAHRQGWVTAMARQHVAALAARARGPVPPVANGDRAVWDVAQQMAEVGRTAHADAQLASAFGVSLHNPFADSRVIDSYLATVAGRMPSPAAYKPVLRAEMSGILPISLLARTTKGVYTPDYHLGLRTHLGDLADLADGRLAALGLIDPANLVTALRRAAAGLSGGLWILDSAITSEAWLHAHYSDELPAWEVVDRAAEPEALTT